MSYIGFLIAKYTGSLDPAQMGPSQLISRKSNLRINFFIVVSHTTILAKLLINGIFSNLFQLFPIKSEYIDIYWKSIHNM